MAADPTAQDAARNILGEKGIAVSCVPNQALLHPWDELRVTIACATDMLGVYQDTLHVQVGTLPRWDVPLRIGVVGTPLQLQVERRLPDGLTVERVSETALTFGDVASGMTHTRHFHAVNTSNLDMHIRWQVFVHCAGEKKVRCLTQFAENRTSAVGIGNALLFFRCYCFLDRG